MILRGMTLDELALALDWAAAEGWNPGVEDAAAFHAADPQGFFVAEVEGAPVAAISVVNHDALTAFLGLYICRPGWRGRGVGLALWRHAMAHAGPRAVGLDGVEAQQANYAASGFVRQGATLRWQGMLGPGPMRGRPARPEDLAALIALDRRANGHARPSFLAAWVAPCPGRRTVVLDGALGPAGFATARRCRDGIKIGPVVAADPEGALALARAAQAATMAETEAPVTLDLPEANAALSAWLRDQGFATTFATARMWRGAAPVPGADLQAVATLELG